MPLHQIKSRDGEVLFEKDCDTFEECVEAAEEAGVNFDGTDLRRIPGLLRLRHRRVRDDLFGVLSKTSIDEVEGLRLALIEGRIDGRTYEGQCACLIGTIAKIRGVSFRQLGRQLGSNWARPAELFFISIRPGHTPQNNQPAKLALEWIDQWLAKQREGAIP